MLALSPRARHPAAMRGFTLVELMVTVSIAAILLMAGVPSFVEFQRNSELTGAANSLLASINAARSEAMKRNFNAMVVPTDGANWKNGWTVFVDSNMNASLDASDMVISRREALPAYFSVTGTKSAAGSAPYVIFNGSGYSLTSDNSHANLTLIFQRNDLSGPDQFAQTRLLKVLGTGRTRVCKPASAQDRLCDIASDD